MKGKKWLAVSLATVLSAGLLAACGGGAATDSNNEGAAGGVGGEEKVTLKMIESLTSPDRTAILQELIDEFESQNPNIEVELISPPMNNADNKIATMLNTKETLDILEVRDHTVFQYVNNGWIADLSQYTSAWEGYQDLNQNALNMANYINDTPYYIPYGLYQKMIYYNTEKFEEKGLTPPTTWDELIETAAALTDPAKNQYGYAFRGGAGAEGFLTEFIRDFNGGNVNTEDAMFLKDGNTIFSTPESVEALTKYVELYKTGSPADSINWGFSEQVQGFISGMTAMLIQDPDTIIPVSEAMPEGQWATAPMPTGPQGVTYYTAGAAGWGITSYTEHPEEAWKLIEFLSSPESNAKFTRVAGVIPIHNSATVDEFFTTGAYKPYIDMADMPERHVAYQPASNYAGFGEWRNIAQQDLQAVLLGQLSVEDALAKWDAYWLNEKANAQ